MPLMPTRQECILHDVATHLPSSGISTGLHILCLRFVVLVSIPNLPGSKIESKSLSSRTDRSFHLTLPNLWLQIALNHLEGLRRWRTPSPPTAEISFYDCVDAHDKRVRVYVYAECWGCAQPREEEIFLEKARNLHDVRARASKASSFAPRPPPPPHHHHQHLELIYQLQVMLWASYLLLTLFSHVHADLAFTVSVHPYTLSHFV
jgi:hypothetical protein